MTDSIETRVTLLEKEDMHIAQALNDHSKRTESNLNDIKSQVSMMVKLQTEIVGISKDLSSMMSNHDRLKDDMNKRFIPVETFITQTKFTLFLIKNTPTIAIATVILSAGAYFINK